MEHMSSWARDIRGSEVVEVVYSAAICCFVIISCMMILGYAVQSNNLAHAGKQIVRAIEISGTAKDEQLENLAKELIPNWDKIRDKENPFKVIRLNDGSARHGYVSPFGDKFQLGERFCLVLKANYKIKVASVGNDVTELSFPIEIRINGQSEVLWKWET